DVVARQAFGTADFDRDFGLWLAYATGEYKVADNWTLTGGVGHGERAPTITELYAFQTFLAILQNGFNSVLGNPDLKKERLWQIALGLRVDYERLRAGANLYYAWVQDYITYQVLGAQGGFAQGGIKVPFQETQGLSLQFVNTELATLSGFELYGETDVNAYL